jgi:hypothetical protein
MPIYKATFVKSFNALVRKCGLSLKTKTPHEFDYNHISPRLWKRNQKQIKKINEDIFNLLGDGINLYALHTKSQRGKKWNIVYIGHSRSKYIKTRITNHLICKDDRTGSVLDHAKEYVDAGGRIGISFFGVEPESLRLSIEAELIDKNKKKLIWNKHGNGKK